MLKKIKIFLLQLNYKTLFFSILGSAIIAFGANIHASAEIPEGGIVGLCLMIENLTGVSTAITNLIINAAFCLLAWRLMGTKYMLGVAASATGFSLFYALFDATIPELSLFTDYTLLAALVGAVFIELGTGITLRYGTAPNGEHALAMALVKRGGLDFGWVNFLRDFIVIFASLCYTDAYSVVYALLIMTITNPITEYIVKAPKKSQPITKTTVKTKNGNMTVNVKAKKASKAQKGMISRLVISLLVIAMLVGATIYLSDYYHADQNSINKFEVQNVEETVLDDEGTMTAYVPTGDIKAGFVFYPGGKVEHTSYAPLLKSCAEQGILCIVIKMPYNLAIFGINDGLDAVEYFPDIDNWYIGGHSLGGSMAANCAANHSDVFKGVILLASYSTTDLSGTRALSIYGTNDKVLNMEKYDKYSVYPPSILEEHIIKGGNHAYFGMYGEQEGDGKATISREEQIEETVAQIVEFVTE